ncbi:hypothetical protein DFH29DRAFT_21527 [Suillus ampliporus]|nr:hypothetical protein DFH29DRAFT_21527 [Suillus ampliporus]
MTMVLLTIPCPQVFCDYHTISCYSYNQNSAQATCTCRPWKSSPILETFTLLKMSLENTRFVVAGARTRIGLVIAQAFANNGAKIYITSLCQDIFEQAAKQWSSSLAHPKGKLVPATCDELRQKTRSNNWFR